MQQSITIYECLHVTATSVELYILLPCVTTPNGVFFLLFSFLFFLFCVLPVPVVALPCPVLPYGAL